MSRRPRALPLPGDCKLSLVAADHEGWLLLDGRLASRAAYPALFAALGTAYGAGDGMTTFGLPKASGAYLRAAGPAKALGSAGGAAAVTLTPDHLPEHDHGVTLKDAASVTRNNLPLLQTGAETVRGLKDAPGTTAKAGAAKPVPVPVEPPFLALNLFVYAGMPPVTG